MVRGLPRTRSEKISETGPMKVFLQALVNGILLGGFYSLMGMGQNRIFGVMNIVNFCHTFVQRPLFCPVLPEGSAPMGEDQLRFFLARSRVYSARVALSTASTMTPTSAKMAVHMFAMPRAPSTRQANLTASANTMFW